MTSPASLLFVCLPGVNLSASFGSEAAMVLFPEDAGNFENAAGRDDLSEPHPFSTYQKITAKGKIIVSYEKKKKTFSAQAVK